MKMRDAGQNMGSPVAYETTEKKKVYPRICLDLDAYPELKTVGSECTLIIRGRIVGLRDDDYGGSIDIEIEECGVAKSTAEENKADKELEAMSSNLRA